MTLIHENELHIPNRNNTHSRARRRLFQIRHATDPSGDPKTDASEFSAAKMEVLMIRLLTALVTDLESTWKIRFAREHLESTDTIRPPSTALLRSEIVSRPRDTVLTCLMLIL
jgi:hypothetical protein